MKELGKPRGRKPPDRRDAQIAGPRRRAERAEAELQKAKKVIEAGKSLSALGAVALDRGRERAREHRAMIEATVEELAPIIGTRPACRALGASPATIYRRRRPPEPRASKPRPTPARALSEPERERVLEVLHSERFVDVLPKETWATLLDEGTYLCSTRPSRIHGPDLPHSSDSMGALARVVDRDRDSLGRLRLGVDLDHDRVPAKAQ